MTTTDPATRSRRFDGNSIIHRLERINTDLTLLSKNLNSYVCEPKTRFLFERMQSLKTNLASIRAVNEEIVRKLKERQADLNDPASRVKAQITAYKELELRILEYIGMAKMHS